MPILNGDWNLPIYLLWMLVCLYHFSFLSSYIVLSSLLFFLSTLSLNRSPFFYSTPNKSNQQIAYIWISQVIDSNIYFYSFFLLFFSFPVAALCPKKLCLYWRYNLQQNGSESADPSRELMRCSLQGDLKLCQNRSAKATADASIHC